MTSEVNVETQRTIICIISVCSSATISLISAALYPMRKCRASRIKYVNNYFGIISITNGEITRMFGIIRMTKINNEYVQHK